MKKHTTSKHTTSQLQTAPTFVLTPKLTRMLDDLIQLSCMLFHTT